MRNRVLPVLLLPIILGACNDILDVNDGKTGFVALPTFSNGTGGYVLSPIGAFYNRSDLAFIPPQLEACEDTPYTTTGSLPLGSSLDAGDALTLSHPGGVESLDRGVEFGLILYRSELDAGIPFTPGDTFTVTVPGGPGFPAATARVRTADPFLVRPVVVPEQGEPVILDWDASPAPGSIMLVALRYADATSTGAPNRQVFCAFNDDGTGSIPFFVASNWANASSGSRQTVFSRARVQEVQVSGKVRFTVTSTFDQPLELLTP